MKTLEIVGWERKDFGKSYTKKLRLDGNVPGVLYSKETLVHFYAPAILFKDLIYTPNAYFIELNVEGTIYKAILQDVQFHPVSEIILHVDFIELIEGQPVVLDIPVKTQGVARGVTMGGKLYTKLRKLKVKANPDSMPDEIVVNVADVRLGHSIKVGAIKTDGYEILNSPNIPVATVEIPRALKSAGISDEEEEETPAEGEATEE